MHDLERKKQNERIRPVWPLSQLRAVHKLRNASLANFLTVDAKSTTSYFLGPIFLGLTR